MAVKEKWRSIGESLKVPSEHLDQFACLTDPLLEVIVHWLNRGGDTPPSWDAVVMALREPTISEADLADRIYRLYCEHKEDKREDDAYSGMLRTLAMDSN